MVKHHDKLPGAEEDVLDEAINSIDPMLSVSLQRDQKRRRKRFLLIGGVVMTTIVVAVLIVASGALTSAGTEAPKDKIVAAEQASDLAQAGWKLWAKQDFTQAEVAFQKALKLDPKSANAWNGLGWCQFNLGQHDKAMESFRRCVEIEGGHAGALNGIGQTYLARREYDQAEKYLVKSGSPAGQWGLIRLYLLTGKFDQAKAVGKKLRAADPNNADLKELMVAAKAGKLDDDLRAKIEPPVLRKGNESEADQLSGRGWSLMNSGKLRPAEMAFRKALEIDKDHLGALNGLGFVLINNNKPAEAKAIFERYLKMQPAHAGALNGLARCQKALGEVDEAIATWQKMDKHMKPPHAGTFGLAFTYVERKQYVKALPLLQQLKAAGIKDPRIQAAIDQAQADIKAEK